MYADVFFAEKPSWSDRSGRRLTLNFLPAIIIILGALAVLHSGDCYRVLDDPNVGSCEAFLTFVQFITTCTYAPDKPQELPWVNELRNRREGQVRYGHLAVE